MFIVVVVQRQIDRLRQQLELKDKEIETVEQAYRLHVEQLQAKCDERVHSMRAKHEQEMHRLKNDTLAKAKSDLEHAQAQVQRLKKTNLDSDRVIDSLKLEMSKIKEVCSLACFLLLTKMSCSKMCPLLVVG